MISNYTTLIISSEFPPGPGGIGQHAASLANVLAKRSNLIILTNQDYASHAEIVEFNTVILEKVSIKHFISRDLLFVSLRRVIQALQIVKKNEIHCVYVTGRFPIWVGAVLKMRYPSLQVEGFAHGSEVTAVGGWLAKVTYWAINKLDQIWAVSSFTKSQLNAQGVKNVRILPNGLDQDFLQKSFIGEVDNTLWKGYPKFLTVGNVTLRKGQHRLIKALPAILKRFPTAHYHIVGLPTKQNEFQKLAEDLGVSDAITFHGRVSKLELLKAYKRSNIFVMLSENQPNGDVEGFGIAIIEANAFGIPAIGAIGCGIEDAICASSGILLDGNDTDAIVNAVETVIHKYSEFRQGARKWAEQHCWDELVKEL